MSLSKWKELADRKAKTGQMKRNLFDEITEEKIRSKTTDEAIAKTFRLDRLDQIAEQTKPKPRRRIQIPRINREGGIDYAPEVDPYEDMDVEGLLNLEDYVPPQAEKQIAKIPKKAPKYEMDPSFWQLSDPPLDPPPLYEEKDPLAIEGPPDDDEDDKFVDAEEGGDDDAEEEESEEEESEEEESEEEESEEDPNKILDELKLPNYNDVDKRLAEPEMTPVRKRSYLTKIIDDAEKQRQKITPIKSNATRNFKAGKISEQERDLIRENVCKIEREIKAYREHYKAQLKNIKGSGIRKKTERERSLFF